jgi:cell volume regulation protein A
VFAAGAVCAVLAQRIKVPDIVLYLLVGMLLGPVLGFVRIPTESVMNQFILTAGAAYILFDGGATLRFRVLKEIWVLLAVIATIGVLITCFITALAAQYFLHLPWMVAVLLGATIASTDPATLVPVFKQVKVKERVAQLVMSESAMNDATGAILTFTVLSMILASASGGATVSIGAAVLEFVRNAGIGLIAGAASGYLAAVLVAKGETPLLRDFMPLVTLLVVAAAYSLAVNYQGSGFMAVFTAGVMLMNNESFGFSVDAIDEEKLEHYVGNTALTFRILIFILLGSQVDFALIKEYLVPGIAVVAVFMLVARPVTVFLCALPDRHAKWTVKEMLFMSWTRETGVIPAALVGLLAGMGAPNIDVIASVTFIAILATILIQASTTRWLAGKLDLLVR